MSDILLTMNIRTVILLIVNTIEVTKTLPSPEGEGLGVGSVISNIYQMILIFKILTPPLPLPYMGGEFVHIFDGFIFESGDNIRVIEMKK